MKPLSPEQLTTKLQTAPSPRPPGAGQLNDPQVETPMQVTLDQLCPYEHNPRFIRNPLYDDLKASIRERGLDQPPPITRRPGAPHFTVRNGGNTRLAILNELWQETRNEQFFRIHCLFRPWDGELCALLGHLAENDLHGQLTFIERAMAVAKAKSMFEENGEPLSQRELSRQLAAGGYSITQSTISRMFDTLEHLLPAIPQALYQGMGRQQIERLIGLRRQALQLWEDGGQSADAFAVMWLEKLAKRDTAAGPIDIEALEHDIRANLTSALQLPVRDDAQLHTVPGASDQLEVPDPSQQDPESSPASTPGAVPGKNEPPRVAKIQQLIGKTPQPIDDPSAAPPSADAAWLIKADLHDVAMLRRLIADQARQFLTLTDSPTCINESDTGIGFVLESDASEQAQTTLSASATLLLRSFLLRPKDDEWPARGLLPSALIGQALLGLYDLALDDQTAQETGLARLPDDALLSLIRLMRLIRTLVDLNKETAP